MKIVAKKEFFNKKARHDYEIIDSMEAGIVLTGDEIKVIRQGRVDMTSSYVKILNGEVFWIGAVFNLLQGERQRTRKLLLHKDQIDKLIGKVQEKGLTLIPLKLYLARGKAKLEIGLGRGLKKFDKREIEKRKTEAKEIDQKIKTVLKG